jgi:hypothetical protein
MEIEKKRKRKREENKNVVGLSFASGTRSTARYFVPNLKL